ncbi:Large cysteine-rich periplasmic protein OmcB precursor [Stieleria maiorica]|uniref:Large cysteine-rich periplasmic protein OmcB n=1 Tax=Stieleria maiorica TaxID=2795974 RepID=A0A5B9MGH1_9BACT|nr:SdrD B-like domain-containing protein [Stieleria maiorica]QEF99953.1 Large cysteine-rich periplasmic protein OmcB precursor [Stieleria maiorica]
MVWQRMIQRLVGRKRRSNTEAKNKNRRRVLRHESLVKRQLLAADIGAISGVAFTDLTGDGLTGDDPRLEGVTVELYRDTNANNTYDAGTDVLVDSVTTDTNADPVPGQYRFDDLSVDTYFVVQGAAPGDVDEPSAQLVQITADDADGATIVTIDDFTSGAQIATAVAAQTVDQSVSAGNALGQFRDARLTHTGAAGNTTFQVDTANQLMSLSTGGGATSEVTVEYDGNDGAFGLTVPPGFSPTSSLAGGTAGGAVPTNTGIELVGRGANQAESMIVTVITSATEASEITVPVQQNATLQSIFVEFTDAGWGTSTLPGISAPADFNSVIAIRAQAVITNADNDIFFSVVESRGPAPVTTNLQNTQLLTLGGNVFSDFGGGADTNNGQLDGGETGVSGVTVELYAEPGGGGAIDPSTQTAVATTTTDGNGDYSFAQLSAGNYLVVIPESELGAGQSLFGHVSSTGNDPAADPDDDVSDDDNGTLVAGVGIVTGEITLVAGAEPTDDGDTDSSTNLSLDIGVVPTFDLAITKTLDSAASTLQSGGEAFFDIAFQNNGPLDATNVVIADVIPAGMTINQGNSNFGTYTPTINGQNLSVAIGALAAGASDTIRIAVDIDNGQTADLTNTATISGDQVETDDTNNSDDASVPIESTDLAITKSDNTTGSVVAGEQFTYTITVTNNGPDTATGIVATDSLPSDLSFVSASFTTGSGTVTENPAGSGDLSISIDDLAASASAVIDVVVMVAADAGNSLSNTATVTGTPDTDSDTSNNSATETTPVVRNVDVAVTKTTTDTAVAGGQLTYTVEVTNNGPGDARGVEVTDTLDSRLTFDSFDAGTSGVTIAQNGQDLTFTVGTLTSGQTETFTFVVDIASSATGTLNNQADITTTDVDTDATNDSDDVDVAITVDTDLVISKSVDLATAVPGQDTLTYTFTISHDTDSVSDSGEVTFTDTLPAGLTGLTIDAPDATSSGFDTAQQTITVVHDPIPVGQTRTFTVTASVNEDASGSIVNTGSISVAGGESDTTNNSDTATTAMTPQFDVTLTKTAGDTTPDPGDNVTYTIELTNSGPSTATNVVLTDDVPTGLTFVSGSLDGQSATVSGSTVTFPGVSLDENETLTATLVFTVGVDTSGTVTNTASVTADSGETDTTNNTATAAITATPQADLTVEKTVDDDIAQTGETLVYTVTVTNDGVSTAFDSVATDTLPSGVTFVSGTDQNNNALSATGGVVTVDAGDLAPGASFSFTINVTIDADASGNLQNVVVVSTTTDESDDTNNSDQATTAVDPMIRSISGSVYFDRDNDGVRDADEVGIQGVTIRLTGTEASGNAIQERTVVTDANGDYEFTQLGAGTYRVEEVQPEDFVSGQNTVGNGATATVVDDVFTDLALGIDDNATDFNFGERAQVLSKRRFLASS